MFLLSLTRHLKYARFFIAMKKYDLFLLSNLILCLHFLGHHRRVRVPQQAVKVV
jgi:hypothetical protein